TARVGLDGRHDGEALLLAGFVLDRYVAAHADDAVLHHSLVLALRGIEDRLQLDDARLELSQLLVRLVEVEVLFLLLHLFTQAGAHLLPLLQQAVQLLAQTLPACRSNRWLLLNCRHLSPPMRPTNGTGASLAQYQPLR